MPTELHIFVGPPLALVLLLVLLDSVFVRDTAAALRQRGAPVTVFLVQNGVLSTRAGVRDSPIARLNAADVTVLADDFSLREHGIDATEMARGVREAPIDALVDLLMEPGTKALWH